MKIYERGLNKVKIGADNERTVGSSISCLRHLLTLLHRNFSPCIISYARHKTLARASILLNSCHWNWRRWSSKTSICEIECKVSFHLLRQRLTYYRVCLAVTKSWKRLLESSHKLWTMFDTRMTRKPVSLTSLKLHLKRSNYTLDTAVISIKAKFDVTRMQYLTRTCKKLRRLEICGSGVVGDSLTAALPLAKSLETIALGANCEISLKAVQLALKTCRKTLVEAAFLRIVGNQFSFVPNQWPELQSLRALHLRAHSPLLLDVVSSTNRRHSL